MSNPIFKPNDKVKIKKDGRTAFITRIRNEFKDNFTYIIAAYILLYGTPEYLEVKEEELELIESYKNE